jgi:hypothetical protein
MRNNKRNTINKHHSSYDRATEHALRAIFEDVDIKIDGQVYSYDKQRNELSVRDFYGMSIYKPLFNAGLCDPFKELIRKEVNEYN